MTEPGDPKDGADAGPVVHNAAAGQFEIRQDGALAILAYTLMRDRIRLDHTEVPDALQGHGIAGRLAKAALEYAQAQHLRVIALCPFVRTYLKRHPEYAALIATDW